VDRGILHTVHHKVQELLDGGEVAQRHSPGLGGRDRLWNWAGKHVFSLATFTLCSFTLDLSFALEASLWVFVP